MFLISKANFLRPKEAAIILHSLQMCKILLLFKTEYKLKMKSWLCQGLFLFLLREIKFSILFYLTFPLLSTPGKPYT